MTKRSCERERRAFADKGGSEARNVTDEVRRKGILESEKGGRTKGTVPIGNETRTRELL
jgi:hypothetical protein